MVVSSRLWVQKERKEGVLEFEMFTTDSRMLRGKDLKFIHLIWKQKIQRFAKKNNNNNTQPNKQKITPT